MSLNGIIPVYKPAGFTSFDVIAKMRGILHIKRLGHTGTLDPMATGVLIVLAGLATKACDIIPDSDKTYVAGFALGKTYDTQDTTGNMISQRSTDNIGKSEIENALGKFRGDIVQIPPMYSAVSVGGQRLYELARKGESIEREGKKVNISLLTLECFDEDTKSGKITVSCSKGTYIRTLINDLGEELGCGAAMTSLLRTRACGFTLEECVTLGELQRSAHPEEFVIPVERAFVDYPELYLDDKQTQMYKNGIRLAISRINDVPDGEHFTVYGKGEFLGTALRGENDELIIHRNFYER